MLRPKGLNDQSQTHVPSTVIEGQGYFRKKRTLGSQTDKDCNSKERERRFPMLRRSIDVTKDRDEGGASIICGEAFVVYQLM